MMREPIHSEKIIVKYKDSMILPRAKESGPQERGIETRKQDRDHKRSSIQTLEQELLLKSSTKFDKGDDISYAITAWLEARENLAQEGGDDPELEGETPECVNWWACECCYTADLVDWDGNSVNQAIARAMKDLETQTIPESLVEQGGLAKDEVAYKKMVSPYDSRKYVEEVENSGPLLDELDVEKEDRMSPVNRVNQERRLEESPDKKIQENIKEITAAELKLKARVKDAEENSGRIGDELDSQRRAVGMAVSEKVDLMVAVASRDTEIEALQAEISKLVLGKEESIEESAPFVEEAKIEEETPLVEEFIQESAPVVEESIKVTPDDVAETEPEDIKSYEEVIIPVEETANDITEEKPTDPVVEDATSVVEEEEKAPVEAEVTPDVDVEEEASSSFEEITVPVEEQVTAATETDIIVPVMAELVAPVEEVLVIAEEEQDKATVEETLVVETDAEEDCSIVDVKEDTNDQEISAPLEEEISLTTVEATKESVAVPLPTEDVPSTLPEEDQVITSEETDPIEETQSIDIEEKEKIEEESVPIVKAETDRGSSVISNTLDMGSMESLEAQTDSASTNSDDDNEKLETKTLELSRKNVEIFDDKQSQIGKLFEKHDIEQVEMLQEQLKEKDEFYEKQEMDLIEKHQLQLKEKEDFDKSSDIDDSLKAKLDEINSLLKLKTQEIEEFRRSNQVPQRNKRAKAGHG